MQSLVVRRPGASVSFQMLDGQVLYAEFQGVLTASGLREFTSARLMQYGHSAAGHVVDYRRALNTVSASEGLSVMTANRARLAGNTPTALIGKLGATQILEDFANEMAMLGFVRRTFVDLPTAHEWVLSMID